MIEPTPGQGDLSSRPDELQRAETLVSRAAAALEERDEELRRLQRVVEAILEVSPPLMVSEHGVVRAWSHAAEAATGLVAAEVIGRRVPATHAIERRQLVPEVDGVEVLLLGSAS